jgi:hypothetical protein
MFAVGRVSTHGNPPLSLRGADAVLDIVVGPLANRFLDFQSGPLAVVGMQNFPQLAPRQRNSGWNVEDVSRARRQRDDVGGGVPAPVAKPGGIEREPQPFRVGKRCG